MTKNTTVIIAEDKKLFRDLIVQELELHEVSTIAVAGNGEELLRQLRGTRPDMVLLDLEMPVMDGNKAMRILAANFPEVKVIILSTHYESTLIDHFIAMGAKGYVPKDALAGNIQVLLDAIETVKQGDIYAFNKFEREDRFTDRQRKIIPLMCDGKTNREIAVEMGINVRGVEKHRHNIYQKTNASSAAGFFRYAFRNGLDFLNEKDT